MLVLSVNLLYGEDDTQTDKAKDELDKAKDTTNESSHHHHHHHDEDEQTCTDMLFGPVVNLIGSYLFNLDFEEDYPVTYQKVTYLVYPYYDDNFCHVIRDTRSGKKFMTDFSLSQGIGTSYKMNSTIMDVDINLSEWAVRNRIRHLKEEKATSAVDTYSLCLERKSIASDFHDSGVSLGIGRIKIDDSIYTGPIVAHNLEIFPVKPVSISLKSQAMFYKNKQIYDVDTSIRYHFKRVYTGISFDYYSIARVEFNTLNLKLGLYW